MNTLQSNSLVAQLVKNLPTMQETWVHSLGCFLPPTSASGNHKSDPFFYGFFVFKVELTYNLMLNSAAQCSDSVFLCTSK